MVSIPKLTPKGKQMVAILNGVEKALKEKGLPHDPTIDKLRKDAMEIFKEKE